MSDDLKVFKYHKIAKSIEKPKKINNTNKTFSNVNSQ